ncbi:iron-containing redox enzyme family protein [Legionella oakridgensis]|uniref:Pyrroloquinoline quinone coenzyme PQQ biosynthesis protein C n=2 Tax=Legionella oakridgensis TaxID=29423 RepID=W0BFA9_9GAMM|nr:iron-containing redox enzyme family protein [Legionella oakridgensis]AHE67287.1 pyrroloquinoline quinone coenzyme PQQ biosynthesis protein C [Legionella oakridgensis ATCC 33761 = DSM 21215]
MFNQAITSAWDNERKKYFAAVFYHLRGYFIDFMWYVANFTNDEEIKDIILKNIQEELGSKGRASHEQLYAQFAEECGVNIHDEIVNKTHYLLFARQFNQEHLRWLSQHDKHSHLAAFSAYERLDNIDYSLLTEFARSLNLSEKAMKFFKVHRYVKHFEPTVDQLAGIWQSSPETVQEAFNFIYSHQLEMWQTLSNTLTTYYPH